MKKKVSFDIITESISTIQKYKSSKLNVFDILETSILYENTLNEEQKEELNIFLDDINQNGWYPYVTEILKDIKLSEEINSIPKIKKDEYIFELLQLEKEYIYLKDLNDDIDLVEIQDKIKYFKSVL